MGLVQEKNKKRRREILLSMLSLGQTTLTELADNTNISMPVVTKIVNSLIKEGLVVEVAQNARKVGRPASMFKLFNKAGYFLGIDIQFKNSCLMIMDLGLNIVNEKFYPNFKLSNTELFIDELEKNIRSFIKESDLQWEKLMGIGVSLPGIISKERGKSETLLNFSTEPINKYLEDRFNKKVIIEHDVKSITFGEIWYGAAENVKNGLCINYGWGLGLGIIIDEKVYYGKNGLAGEFGHIKTVLNGNMCY